MADWKLINSIKGIYNISVKSLDEQVNDNPNVTTTGGFATSTNTLLDQNGNTVFLIENFKESQTNPLEIDVMRRAFTIIVEKDTSPQIFSFFTPYFYDSLIPNTVDSYVYWCKAFTNVSSSEDLCLEYAIKVTTIGKNIGDIEIYSNVKYIPGSTIVKPVCNIIQNTLHKDLFAPVAEVPMNVPSIQQAGAVLSTGGTSANILGDVGYSANFIGRETSLDNINLFSYTLRMPFSFGNGTSAGNDRSILAFGNRIGDSTTNAYGQLLEVRGCEDSTKLAGFNIDYDNKSINYIYGSLAYTTIENTNTIFSVRIPIVAFSSSIDELVKTTSDDSTVRVFGKTIFHRAETANDANAYASYRVIVKRDCSGSTATSFGTVAIYDPVYGRYVVSINSLYGSVFPPNVGDETIGPILTYQDIGPAPEVFATYVRIIRGEDYYTAEFY